MAENQRFMKLNYSVLGNTSLKGLPFGTLYIMASKPVQQQDAFHLDDIYLPRAHSLDSSARPKIYGSIILSMDNIPDKNQ